LPNTYTKLLVHVVFGTKNRTATIPADLREDFYSYIGGIVRGEGGSLRAIGGMPDHVHLLVRVGPRASISNLMQKLKANSSRWLSRRIRRGSFSWQSGYAAFSVSGSAAGAVMRYIANQQEHHRKRSFREEVIELLDRHGVEYDARYLPG
jgi:putative transposase